ncbi:helix-turn-helix domain-containing protein [Emticicia soli]|uniref:Helix-turn-helix domain-containing protein n=1 Tax=Emticicia soli TaxID=2027878 RepID=A0ABW5J619_9BACT
MQVICLEEDAFYTLVEQVVARLKKEHTKEKAKWISDEEAMQLLSIKSKTTLQKLRDEGKIRFSQPQPRIILYDTDSINQYLERNARETF